MNTIAIENAVQEFREQQIQAMHRRLNATAPRDQTSAFVASEMRGVDRLVASYRESLGTHDLPVDEQQANETPTPAVVLPGTK